MPLFDEMAKRAIADHPELSAPTQVQPQVPEVAPSHSGMNKGTLATFLAGLGADAASTAMNASHGAHEQNPAFGWAGDKMAAPLILAESGLGTYLANRMFGKSHPKIMNAITLGAGMGHAAGATSNIYTAIKNRQHPAN